MASFTIGDRVLILGKNATGKIAFVGHTHFLDGLCFGVILDEPKGRNNGSFDGVRYFKCPRNHGIFVRSCQLREISRNESKMIRTEDRTKNTIKYPNYLKAKNALQLHQGKRKQKNAALRTRRVSSDTQFTPLQTNHQLKRQLNKQNTVSNKESYLRNTELTKNMKNRATNPSTKMLSILNSDTYDFQEPEPQAFDNQVVTETVKMKHRIKNLETELKYARQVIENNTTDKEHLEEQLNYYQKHEYALQKKINKLSKDLAESDRKIKTLEQKMEKLDEITETSIIEKEMSEHNTEELEAELQELTTTLKILRTELSIKEEEMQIQCENKVPTVHYMKQLECQNKVLYNALLQLRKMYISKHRNLLEAEDSIKNNLSTLKDLTTSQEKLENVIFVLNQDVSDMHETIDGLAEADELVYEITDDSLTLEHKMDVLVETLKIMEEYIEVSNEIEEILQECYMEREKDMEALEHKVCQTEKSLMNAINLVSGCKDELERYKNLVTDLRMKNGLLEFKLYTVTQERNLAVIEAENLKLQFNRQNEMTLKHFIKDDNLEIENQVFQQQVKYLELYFPENFLGRNEHLALQGKLVLSKIIQKLDLFQKYIVSRSFKYPFPSTKNQLQTLIFQTHFLYKILILQELLKTYNASLDHANIKNFLSSGAYCEILNIKLREINHYLNLFCRNELDTPNNIESLNNTINMFYAMLNVKFCPERQKRMLRMEYLLNKTFVCVKCIEAHFMAFKTSLKYLENEDFINIESACSTLTKDISYLLNCITVSEGHPMMSCNEDTVCHLKHVLFEIVGLMERVVKIYDRIYDRDENFNAAFLLKDLQKLEGISIEIHLMKDLVQEGETLEAYDPAVSSTFASWIRDKKIQKEQWINELQRKAFILEKNLSNINQHRIKEKQFITQIKEKSSQTDANIYEIIKSEDLTILSLKLHDMELSANFLNFKVHQLQMERMQNQLSGLTPLKVPPKRKRYHPDVHKIIVFQKSLNKISDDLMKIILPTVVDISSKRNICKNFKTSALTYRDMIKKDIQKRLQNLETEIHDFKNGNRFK
ncbi:Dynactin subunit 1 [Araneus ventricosus]|uniref:Dynactin subunit 1 n=1 Tax=Araneus ventricosus TaxID=182803 RepID=A0A4Y2F2W0_ARAVE|nr:Dynactin subunit 1 [Araneus ventricosus]